MKTKRANKLKTGKLNNDAEIQELQTKYAAMSTSKEAIKRFNDFPLSQKTMKGLSESKYTQPTDIQRDSIGPALQGKDVLGAAQTGSGKTLAFLIPVLEHLYINKWSRTDGVCAIIISPTRELAYQIFETLKKVGRHHDFSAGLIIGGKNLKFERKRMDQCNILICTPGRLLQHMDENPLFDTNTMEMLVLDEADRCLDMGFEQALNAIIENLPPQRQTLLYSATQTNSVQDLARLNLTDPVYVGYTQTQNGAVQARTVVPELLQQNYVVVALEDKITMLWSFIRNHLKHKTIVFLSSCKQVKYVYEIFCKLRPGVSLLALYGTLHQDRRIAIYNDFVRKSHVVMFATDIASRGLDFPAVNWVVQLDCPEDVTQYIHRAGRSARNKARGESLLVLLPNEEEAMVKQLQQQQIEVRQIHIDPKKLFSPRVKMEAFLAQSTELKASAQRAFVSYIKSIFLMRNKRVFNVAGLDLDAYARSLGLAVTPRVKFLERFMWQSKLAERRKQDASVEKDKKSDQSEGEDDDDDDNDNETGVPHNQKQVENHKINNIKSKLLRTETDSSDDDDDDDVSNDGENSEDDDSNSDITLKQSIKEQTKKTKKSTEINFNVLRADTDSDNDDEDFIKVKRLNHDLVPTEDDAAIDAAVGPVPVRPKKDKLITKAALAKKAIKKKLQMNERRKFDEEGMEIADVRKQLQSTLGKQYEEQTDEAECVGGIDIAKVKQLLSEEDKYDKQRFRELIKQRHKKRKEKLKKQLNDADAAVADYESGDDDDDDEHSVDLSWLPDPDKVYNKQNGKHKANESDEEEHDRHEGDEDNDEFSAPPVSKKMKVTSKLTLNDAEVIAAQLLAKSF